MLINNVWSLKPLSNQYNQRFTQPGLLLLGGGNERTSTKVQSNPEASTIQNPI